MSRWHGAKVGIRVVVTAFLMLAVVIVGALFTFAWRGGKAHVTQRVAPRAVDAGDRDDAWVILDAPVPVRSAGPEIRAPDASVLKGLATRFDESSPEVGIDAGAEPVQSTGGFGDQPPVLGEPDFRVVWAGYGTHERLTNVTVEVRERAATVGRIDTKPERIREGLQGSIFDTLFELDGVLMRMLARTGGSAIWLSGGRPPGPAETEAESERVSKLGLEHPGVEVVWARFGKHDRGNERFINATDEVRRMLEAEGGWIQNSRASLGLADPVPGWEKYLWVMFSVRGRPMCVALRKGGQLWIEPSLENRRRPPGL